MTTNHVDRAEGHERARRYDKARVAYKEALQSAPDSYSRGFAARRFASALAFWGELAPAAAMLERAVTEDPTNPAGWHDLGILRARLGNVAGAETALREARGLASTDPRPRIALAALLVKSKRYSEAQTEYKELLKLEIPDKTRTAIGRALKLLAAEPPL